MNYSLLIMFLMSVLSVGCLSQVNTSDPQISRSIKESKRNGFFIKRYFVNQSTDSNIIIEEAWLEQAWFYEIHDRVVEKVAKDWCRLCFKVRQTSKLSYRLDNLSEWSMKYSSPKAYVGISYGIYKLTFQNFIVPDSIQLDLIKRHDTGNDIIDTKVGELTFKAVPEPTAKE